MGEMALATRTLAELEAVIERGRETFIEVGEALLEIRDGRKYREAGYTDFDTYCRERWGWSRFYAHRQIDAAQVALMLPIGNRPENEHQARQLAPLIKANPDAVRAEVAQAIENGSTPAEAVKAVIRNHGAPPPASSGGRAAGGSDGVSHADRH